MIQSQSIKERASAVKLATLIGGVVNLILSVVKIIIGVLANSQSLLADGLHSLSDLLSDVLVWFAAHHAAEGPDDDHPYGHGRFEILATLMLGSLLLLVAIGIAWNAFSQLMANDVPPSPGMLAVYAAIFSIISKEILYHYNLAVAKKVNSSLLRANAWHHRTDAISSVIVLIGLVGTYAGFLYLDALAAVVVGMMIARIGWGLAWDAMQDLADRGLDEERQKHIKASIREVGGVKDMHLLRTRTLGGHASADVHVLVDSRISVSEGHMISVLVEQKLKQEIDEIEDVMVHIDPEDDEKRPQNPDMPQRHELEKQLQQSWSGLWDELNERTLQIHYLNHGMDLDVILPKNSGMTAEVLKDRLPEGYPVRQIRVLEEVST
jgi:cation diffusion facilitator family transporter